MRGVSECKDSGREERILEKRIPGVVNKMRGNNSTTRCIEVGQTAEYIKTLATVEQ